MARKFKLPEKTCTLGKKFTSNGEGEGEKREDVVTFSLEGLMLTGRELDKILGEGAHERLFTKGKGSDALEPAFGEDVNELKLVHRYIDSTVTLSLDGETLTLAQSKILKVVLQPQVGGMTWMACDIEAPAVEGVDAIRKHSGLKIAAHLAFGTKPVNDKRQKSLALNEGEDGEEDDDEASDSRGRGKGKANGERLNAGGES
jgi:hypothetical protein